MVQTEVYFDESYGSRVFCVAGYIMEKSQAISLTQEWHGVLAARRLPYFRMSECAHGNGPFKALTKSARSQIALRMIQVIEKYTIQGIAVTINNSEFDAVSAQRRTPVSAYLIVAHAILTGIQSWLTLNPTVKKMAYFFEAGHPSQAEANGIMNALFKIPDRRAAYRYGGHAFVEKEETPASKQRTCSRGNGIQIKDMKWRAGHAEKTARGYWPIIMM